MRTNSNNIDRLDNDEIVQDEFDFTSQYSDNLPLILQALNISLVVTSYQSSRLILVRSQDDSLETHLCTFPRPMGVYADRQQITLGTLGQVISFKRSDGVLKKVKAGQLDAPDLGKKLQEQDPDSFSEYLEERKEQLDDFKQADALYLQRASITTGMINIHDIAWGNEGLWVVNSAFSCLATLSPDYSFVARWKPPFIDRLVPEDRCHLNGMAMLDGRPKYVTTFNQNNTRDSWQGGKKFNGTLINIDNNTILLDDLILPHSPRCHHGLVYFCDSGRGEVHSYDPATRQRKTVCKLPGFTRGLTFVGDLMLVGLSKIRQSESAHQIPLISDLGVENSQCGIWLVNLTSGEEIARLSFNGDVEQVYDIAVVEDSTVPALSTQDSALDRHLFEFTQESLL